MQHEYELKGTTVSPSSNFKRLWTARPGEMELIPLTPPAKVRLVGPEEEAQQIDVKGRMAPDGKRMIRRRKSLDAASPEPRAAVQDCTVLARSDVSIPCRLKRI